MLEITYNIMSDVISQALLNISTLGHSIEVTKLKQCSKRLHLCELDNIQCSTTLITHSCSISTN